MKVVLGAWWRESGELGCKRVMVMVIAMKMKMLEMCQGSDELR